MEAVLRAQEETERKRIEETKFTRMTVEQQEIFLAKQKQVIDVKKAKFTKLDVCVNCKSKNLIFLILLKTLSLIC